MITIEKKEKYCEVILKGKITHADYEEFIPKIESYIDDSGDFRLLADVRDMEGWEIKAGVDDFKFGMKHRNNFQRIALLGDKKWQQYISKIGAFLMKGEIRYFFSDDQAKAIAWLDED